jgi:hypothetical protein
MGWRSRLKRYNLFPHLVAEDLACGIEHTPINKLEERQQTTQFGGTATGAQETINQNRAAGRIGPANPDPAAPFVVNRDVQFTNSANAKKATTIPKLVPKQFPIDLSANKGLPYVLFKIFNSETGAVEIDDATTRSLVTGAQRGVAVLGAVPGGEAVAAAIFGGVVAGPAGSIAALLASTESGQNAIDAGAQAIFGSDVSITTTAKDLVKSFALKRNIQQLQEAIALFMPDGITSNYDHEYDALSVTATLGAAGFAAQAVGSMNGAVEATSPYIAEAAAAIASKVVGGEDFAKLGLFATSGLVRNPQMELIYSSPVLRKFVFDFRLIPRSNVEAAAILDIIESFKFHSAPEILSGAGGRYLIPPAQFQIEFYNGDGTQNLKLFKTKNCVLTGISVDYTPNGFATFYDGMPVEIRMQLNFQETSIISKSDIRGVFAIDDTGSTFEETKIGY